MAKRNALDAYRTAEIGTLSQRELIVRLYRGAERLLATGSAAYARGDRAAGSRAWSRARRIVVELCATLDLERGGAVAASLRDVYLFVIARITAANLHGDPAQIADVLPLLADLRAAWEAMPADTASPRQLPG